MLGIKYMVKVTNEWVKNDERKVEFAKPYKRIWAGWWGHWLGYVRLLASAM